MIRSKVEIEKAMANMYVEYVPLLIENWWLSYIGHLSASFLSNAILPNYCVYQLGNDIHNAHNDPLQVLRTHE